MATREVFSADELTKLRGFPEPARAELIRHFTLTPADEAFVRKFRGRENVLGVAVQLCTLPWLGAGEVVPRRQRVAMVAAAVCAGGTATHGVMALRLFDESVSATRTEPQR